MRAQIPPEFAASIQNRPAEPAVSGSQWLCELPRLIDDVRTDWELEPDGATMFGQCALVVPVRAGGAEAILKLTWPHPEAATEHLALRAWDGAGAVRLLRADPRRWALLLERLESTDLTTVSIVDSCEAIGALMARLDRPALPQPPRLSELSARWMQQLEAGSRRVPRRFTEQAGSLLRDLSSAAHVDDRLVHQDLHFHNVLAARRGPWLAIDPKPVAGMWEFAVAPALWNLPELTAAAHNPRAHLLLRLGLICDAAGLDEDRAAAWTFVRAVLNALWQEDDPGWVTQMITVAKAMTG